MISVIEIFEVLKELGIDVVGFLAGIGASVVGATIFYIKRKGRRK